MILHGIIFRVVSSAVQSVLSMGDKIFLTSNMVLNKTAAIPTHSFVHLYGEDATVSSKQFSADWVGDNFLATKDGIETTRSFQITAEES